MKGALLVHTLFGVLLAAALPAAAQSFSIDALDVAGTPRHEGKPSRTIWAGETAEIQARVTVPGGAPISHPVFTWTTDPAIATATHIQPAVLEPGTTWVSVGRLPLRIPGKVKVTIKAQAGRFTIPEHDYEIDVLAPDLQAQLPRPMAARFLVRNEGDIAAPPTRALLTCRATAGGFGKNNTPPSGPNGCPAPFFSELPGRWFPIPAINPHQSFTVTLAGWEQAVWAPGTYEFAVVADAGNRVIELLEGNNTARSGLVSDAQGRTR